MWGTTIYIMDGERMDKLNYWELLKTLGTALIAGIVAFSVNIINKVREKQKLEIEKLKREAERDEWYKPLEKEKEELNIKILKLNVEKLKLEVEEKRQKENGAQLQPRSKRR